MKSIMKLSVIVIAVSCLFGIVSAAGSQQSTPSLFGFPVYKS